MTTQFNFTLDDIKAEYPVFPVDSPLDPVTVMIRNRPDDNDNTKVRFSVWFIDRDNEEINNKGVRIGMMVEGNDLVVQHYREDTEEAINYILRDVFTPIPPQ
jgi:hypothetical protein